MTLSIRHRSIAVLAVIALLLLLVEQLAAPGASRSGDARPIAAGGGDPMAAGPADLVSAREPVTASPALTTDTGDPSKLTLGLSLVSAGFTSPVLVTSARDGSGRLFVVEQTGRIRIIKNGAVLAKPFFDIRGRISTGGERGLLGLAFHPNFATHPFIYVNFTTTTGATAISRYRVSSNPDVVDQSTGGRILTIDQPYANHNGGNLAFGPDGYLYIGMGDGGSAGDPQNRAQNLNSLLGKMLRIDVDHTSGSLHYRSPAGNPYLGRAGRDEIWSRGLRNPWRWSFDRATGNLWIGDVGQGRYEEIDRSIRRPGLPAGRAENFGWPVLEGRACYRPSTHCSTTGKHPPIVAYAHTAATTANCAVTGGFVYRGHADPVLQGAYLFGDFCSGRIWGIWSGSSNPAPATLLRGPTTVPQLAISSFGEDEAGELYVCDLVGGAVYRITAAPKP